MEITSPHTTGDRYGVLTETQNIKMEETEASKRKSSRKS